MNFRWQKPKKSWLTHSWFYILIFNTNSEILTSPIYFIICTCCLFVYNIIKPMTMTDKVAWNPSKSSQTNLQTLDHCFTLGGQLLVALTQSWLHFLQSLCQMFVLLHSCCHLHLQFLVLMLLNLKLSPANDSKLFVEFYFLSNIFTWHQQFHCQGQKIAFLFFLTEWTQINSHMLQTLWFKDVDTTWLE